MVMTKQLVRAASMDALRGKGSITAQVEGHPIVLFLYGDRVFAIDNRCPHMGFPLDRGTVKDGILTCHWHHARFDLASGGTFDQWADDVASYPVEVHGDDIMIDLNSKIDPVTQQRQRLHDGLERNISLVIAKTVINLLRNGIDPAEPFTVGLEFGTQYRRGGWGRGLTTHGCLMNMIPFLEEQDRPRALYHGLSDVANDTDSMAPHFTVRPLPLENADAITLKRWLRQFVEVRDSEAVERCITSAIKVGASQEELADMLFAAATDHRYLDLGHTLDFINTALESLDNAGWEHAEAVLSSTVRRLTQADRMEESNAWRYPVDLIAILDEAFIQLPGILETVTPTTAPDLESLTPVLLGDDPQAIADLLLDALRQGVSPADLAGAVSYAAARRIAQFHTSNEFGDWDTALHTFTFANAVQHGLRRVSSADLVRGIFDAAMSVYLDRFLNVPAVPLPKVSRQTDQPDALLNDLETLLNRQQQVNEAGQLVMDYLGNGGDPAQLMAKMGNLLLREDRNFHTIQCIHAAFRQHTLLAGTPQADHVLVAAARYLAAHAPTMRAQGQTYRIAYRLSHGERLFEGD